jgi:2-polyprenyl-3-methyl-5-hydroxy-6-metoxy-1,4-benzoquinol methylase
MQRLETFVDWGQKGWDSFFAERGSHWRDKDYRYLRKIFDLRKMSGSLLDVGCGLGDGLVYLKRKCSNVSKFVGTDFSNKAIDSCRNNPQLQNIEFFAHDILRPLPMKYDNIICLQTLEHLKDPQTAIHNLIEATQNLLIVGAPYRNRRPDENHLWSFNEDDFSGLMESFRLDKKQKNIYWLLDKQKKGVSFRKSVFRIFNR